MDKYPKEFIEQLQNIENIDIVFNKDLSLYSTMRLKSIGDLFTIKSLNGLKNCVALMAKYNIPYNILGLGANVLLPEKSNTPYIQLKFSFDKAYLSKVRAKYSLPASVNLSILSSCASKHNLSGWEVFTGIPATLGGAIYMNAGTNLGEIGPLIESVSYINNKGEEKQLKMTAESFSYRKNHFLNKGDIIFQIEMIHNGVSQDVSEKIKSYLSLRNSSQPLKAYTCGCVFKNKNNCSVGKLIDLLGLKGLRVGNVQVSKKHANFIENLGEGTKTDVLALISLIKKEIYLHFGVQLETEVIMSY